MEPFLDEKITFLKENLARSFDIDETFVDISSVRTDDEDKDIYRCELKLRTSEKYLRRFHLSVYFFNIYRKGRDGFVYEDSYYAFDEIHSFLERLKIQVKEPNRN